MLKIESDKQLLKILIMKEGNLQVINQKPF